MGCTGSATSTATVATQANAGARVPNPLMHRPVPVPGRRNSLQQALASHQPEVLERNTQLPRPTPAPLATDLLVETEDELGFLSGVSSASIAMLSHDKGSRSPSVDSTSNGAGMSGEAASSATTDLSTASPLRSEGSGSGSEFPSASRRQSRRIGGGQGSPGRDSGENDTELSALRIMYPGRTQRRRQLKHRDSIEDFDHQSDGEGMDDSVEEERCRRLAGDIWESELGCAIPSADDRYDQLRLDQSMFTDEGFSFTNNGTVQLVDGDGLLWQHPDLHGGLPCPLRFFPLLATDDDQLTPATPGPFSTPWSKPHTAVRKRNPPTFEEALREYVSDDRIMATERLKHFARRTAEQATLVMTEFHAAKFHSAHRFAVGLRNFVESFPRWHRLRVIANEICTAVCNVELLEAALDVSRLLNEMSVRGDDLAIPSTLWNRNHSHLPSLEGIREFCHDRAEYCLNIFQNTVEYIEHSARSFEGSVSGP